MGTYTREDVMAAVNAGVDLVLDELALGECQADLVNLVVNAIGTVLDNPGASLDQVIEENYDEDPAEVRAWALESVR